MYYAIFIGLGCLEGTFFLFHGIDIYIVT